MEVHLNLLHILRLHRWLVQPRLRLPSCLKPRDIGESRLPYSLEPALDVAAGDCGRRDARHRATSLWHTKAGAARNGSVVTEPSGS